MSRETGCNPELIQAAIGPSISQEAFEVGEEVVEAFRQSGAWTAEETLSLCWNNPKTGKTHIDLWKANELQLQAVPDRSRMPGFVPISTPTNSFLPAAKESTADVFYLVFSSYKQLST